MRFRRQRDRPIALASPKPIDAEPAKNAAPTENRTMP